MRKGQVYLNRPYAFVNVNFHLLWHAGKLRILYEANFLYRNKKGFLSNYKTCIRSFAFEFSKRVIRFLMITTKYSDSLNINVMMMSSMFNMASVIFNRSSELSAEGESPFYPCGKCCYAIRVYVIGM